VVWDKTLTLSSSSSEQSVAFRLESGAPGAGLLIFSNHRSADADSSVSSEPRSRMGSLRHSVRHDDLASSKAFIVIEFRIRAP